MCFGKLKLESTCEISITICVRSLWLYRFSNCRSTGTFRPLQTPNPIFSHISYILYRIQKGGSSSICVFMGLLCWPEIEKGRIVGLPCETQPRGHHTSTERCERRYTHFSKLVCEIKCIHVCACMPNTQHAFTSVSARPKGGL